MPRQPSLSNNYKQLYQYQYDPSMYTFDSLGRKKFDGWIKDNKENKVVIKQIGRIPALDYRQLPQYKMYQQPMNQHVQEILAMLDTPQHIFIVQQKQTASLSTFMRQVATQEMGFEIFLDILAGYSTIRKLKLVHGNINPSTIIRVDDQFKIGRLEMLQQPNSVSQLPNMSYHYCAPEVRSHRIVNEKSDIWNMGMILFEMLGPILRNEGVKWRCGPYIRRIINGCLEVCWFKRFSYSGLLEYILKGDHINESLKDILFAKANKFYKAGIKIDKIHNSKPNSERPYKQKFFILFVCRFLCLLKKSSLSQTNLSSATQFYMRARIRKYYQQYPKHSKSLHDIIKIYDRQLKQLKQVGTQLPFMTSKVLRIEQSINYQHVLKNVILDQVEKIGRQMESQSIIEGYENDLVVLDFALSIFVLNRETIEKGYKANWDQISADYMQKLATLPVNRSLQIAQMYEALKRKIVQLGFNKA